MLDIRPTCENCNKALAYDSKDAMICTFECTFCIDCVENILQHVCPNCGGGFENRPIRPKQYLETHPASTVKVSKKVDFEAHFKKINSL